MRQDDFNCEKGLREGRIEIVIEGPGSYHQAWCPVKKDYIPNCNYCEYNELEKEVQADPNDYKKWLKRGGKHKYERT